MRYLTSYKVISSIDVFVIIVDVVLYYWESSLDSYTTPSAVFWQMFYYKYLSLVQITKCN